MSLDEYAYLWNGTQPGWRLQYFCRMEWLITFRFSLNGPTLEEVRKLRGLPDEFRDTPTSEVWNRLRGQQSYTLADARSNLEMRRLTEDAGRLQLPVSVEARDDSGYLPVHVDGFALVIEDDTIADKVARRMIEAGVEVEEIHVD